jgi:hypothetical protein
MEILTHEYLFRAEMALLITTLLYFVMNGAGIFETAVLVPKWSSNAPISFQLLKEPYGVDLKKFWIIMHCVHELSFILAIILCWKISDIRNYLLILFGLHFLIRVWTLTYFAPTIMKFQRIANTDDYSLGLPAKAKRWRHLNYIRTGLFIAISLALVPLCIQLCHMAA